MLIDQFLEASFRYKSELHRLSPGILSRMPIETCVNYNKKKTPFDHYFDPHKKLVKQLDTIEQVNGPETLSVYLKYLLSCCVL